MQWQAVKFKQICTDIITDITLSNNSISIVRHGREWQSVSLPFCVCASYSRVGWQVDQWVTVQSAGGLTRKKPKYRCGDTQGHGGWNIKRETGAKPCKSLYTPSFLHSFHSIKLQASQLESNFFLLGGLVLSMQMGSKKWYEEMQSTQGSSWLKIKKRLVNWRFQV